jgi:pentose-5-phosphate-3-epimerase
MRIKGEVVSMTKDERIERARNESTPAELLTRLAQDEHWHVRYAVAANPHTPAEVLSELARDKGLYVRGAVALNPHTPVEVLTKLAGDEEWDVRYCVAKHPSTPAEVLAELAQDEAEAVRKAAEWNRKTRKAAGNSKSYEVEIEGRVRKTYTVDAVSEEAAIEQAHEIFSVSNEEGVDEEYHQETVRVNEVQEDEGIKI